MISLQNVSKSYGDKKVIKNVSLTIPAGTIFALLGPNGAGKTTLIRLMNGVLSTEQGSINIAGYPVTSSDSRFAKICGVLTETAACYEYLTGLENLLFFAELYGLGKEEAKKRSMELLEKLSILDAKDQKVKAYSTGMKKRLSLARALLHHPKILFLDEPTSGLDPESAREVTSLILQLAVSEQVTVFICTHQLSYAQAICQQYAFIDKGEIIAQGTFLELLKRYEAPRTLHLRMSGSKPTWFQAIKEENGDYTLPIHGDSEVPAILQKLLGDGVEVYEARQEQWDLEQLYFAVMKRRNEHA